MMSAVAVAVVAAAGVFLAILGVAALVRPRWVARFLLGFAASGARHGLELACRVAVGAALIRAAPGMAGAAVIAAAGWILLGTTAVLLCVPWRVHRAFAQRTVPRALAFLPAIGVASIAAGAGLLWALLRAP